MKLTTLSFTVLSVFLTPFAFGETENCGLDLHPLPTAFWTTSEISADLDGNGKVQVLDLVKHVNQSLIEITECAGLDVDHQAVDNYFITGQAWGDVNGDGRPDLLVTNCDGPNKLYINQGNDQFTLSPFNPTIALDGEISGGASICDYDNDGWNDIYILNKGANRLFRNLSGTGFEDVTAQAGVGDTGIGESAAWGDVNQDGLLDLYLVNWNFTEAPDRLFLNQGNGQFLDADLLPIETAGLKGFAASFADLDNDGDLDLYVVNDKRLGNVLYRNDGPGCNGWCFTDVSVETASNTEVDGMGLAVGDYDNDGDLDLFFSHSALPVLLQNQTAQGSFSFIDVTLNAGITTPVVAWGTFFFDFDNDGHLDIFLAGINASFLYRNLGNGTFVNRTDKLAWDQQGWTTGANFADINEDGWLDWIVGIKGEGYHLFKNFEGQSSTNHWLSIDLLGGAQDNHMAVGSRVTVTTDMGQVLTRELKNGSSIGGNNQHRLHFGLGTDLVDSVHIRWPNGETSVIVQPAVDQVLTVLQDTP